MTRRLLIAGSAALWLCACANDNVEPPAPLAAIAKPQLTASEVWSRSIAGTEATAQLHITAAADGTNVYTLTSSGTFTHGGLVYALSLKSGGTNWSVKTDLSLTAGPAVNDGIVVVAAADGTVLALKSTDGSSLWKSQVTGEILATPAVSAGTVVVRTTDGRVLALDADTGKQRWKTGYDVPRLSLRGAAPPVIVDRMVFVGLDDGRLVALDIGDGHQLWQAVVGTPSGGDELSRLSDVDGVLAVDGDTVYAVAYHGQIAAISRQSGQILWSRDMSSYTGVSVDSDYVYVTDAHSAVWALDKNNGSPIWTQPAMRAHDLTVPTPFQGVVVVGGIEGTVHFLSRKDGSVMQRVSLDSAPIVAPPLVVGDTVVVLSTGGDIAVYVIVPTKAG
jgi:outer membrane protein assembly factor BamB